MRVRLAGAFCAVPLLLQGGGTVAPGPPSGPAAFRQALLDAGTAKRALIVATHPDDPYFAPAVVLRRYGVEVRILLATRGEGGQNAIGSEQGSALGRLRTREARAAAERLGCSLRFLDLVDFGFCRTAAEALARWQDRRPEARLRAQLEDFDPDLVLTPHRPGEAHGQKKAVFHLLRRAVGERPFLRGVAAGEKPDFVFDLAVYDPLAGRSLQEEAYAALRLHRSQGPFRPIDEAVPRRLQLKRDRGLQGGGFLESLPSIWERGDELDRILARAGRERDVADLRRELDGRLPRSLDRDRATALALSLLPDLRVLVEGADGDLRRRLARRLAALERAILLGAGFRFRVLRVGSGLRLRAENGGSWPASLRIRGHAPEPLDPGRRLDLPVPPGTGPVRCELGLGGVKLELRAPRPPRGIEHPHLRPLAGESFLVSAAGGEVPLPLLVEKPRGRPLAALLEMAAPVGVRFVGEFSGRAPVEVHLPAGAAAQVRGVRLLLPPAPADLSPPPPWVLRFDLKDAAGRVLATCNLRLFPIPIRVPAGLRVGIVRGPDRTVEESLRSLGIEVAPLDPRTLARTDLRRLDSILVDSRAMLRRPDLPPQAARLLSYVEAGGRLVVLYHKAQEFNAEQTGVLLAPYPLHLGRARVTREDAPVEVLRPDHPLLNRPNRIRPSDWDGWVQERGLYFPQMGAYDRRYEELLEIRETLVPELEGLPPPPKSETGPQRGALLFARYGKGSYVYCALVLHRQLAAGRPGAARLLVNFLTPAR